MLLDSLAMKMGHVEGQLEVGAGVGRLGMTVAMTLSLGVWEVGTEV